MQLVLLLSVTQEIHCWVLLKFLIVYHSFFFLNLLIVFHHSSFAPHWSHALSLKTVCLRQHLNWIIPGKNRCLKATYHLHKFVPLLKCLLRFLRLQYSWLFFLRLPDSETEIFRFSVFNNFLKPSLISSDILCLMTYIPFHWLHLMGFPISGILFFASWHFWCFH